MAHNFPPSDRFVVLPTYHSPALEAMTAKHGAFGRDPVDSLFKFADGTMPPRGHRNSSLAMMTAHKARMV